jgi:hypothetical protein
MAKDGDPSKSKQGDKEAALAAALRANLRRRKASGGKPVSATDPKPAGGDKP